MSLTLIELKTEIDEIYKDLTLQDWKDKSDYRCITQRSQKDFDNLIPMYVRKISMLRFQLAGEWDFSCKVSDDGKTFNSDAEIFEAVKQKMNDWHYANSKEQRLFDKLATCLKEVEMRESGEVIRTELHDQAVYYIDYGQADDTGDGLTTGNAFKTITKYTTTEIRTAGDIAYVRANVTWAQGTEAVDIAFDEDGDVDNRIKIIGCDSVTNDPWGDSLDVKPIIDFENAAFQWYLLSSNFWWFERLDSRQSDDSNGIFRISLSNYIYLKDCNFQDVNNASGEGIIFTNSYNVILDGCTFLDCQGVSLSIVLSLVLCQSCTFTAGVDVSTDYGVFVDGGIIFLEDCIFAGTFDNKDIYVRYNGIVYSRNADLSGSGVYVSEDGGVIYSEDDNATFESQVTTFYEGTITRGTTSPRSGGADSFAIMAPNAGCGLNSPLILGHRLAGFAKIWVATNDASTITVYVRVDSAWDSALAAGECYIKASYLDNAGDSGRTVLQSSEQITNDTNWTALTVTIPASNPKRDGWVYVWFYLEEYEDATEKVDVDIKPMVS